MRLKGKVAVITGGTKGVGRGIAHRFAEEGASVVFTGRSEDLGRAVEREIRDAGGKAMFVRADLAIEEDCRNMIEVAEREFGPLSTLVNNAAATHMIGTAHPHADKRMHLLSNETLDIMWKSDMYGFFWCCRYALRAMLANGRTDCSIINISSGAGAGGGGEMDAYAASKAAMNGVTLSMAGEYARSGIRVNAIVLGLINNGGGVAAILANDEMASAVTSHIPLPFVGEPDDIAWGAVYLASDQARYVTGALLPIDGGANTTTMTEEMGTTGWAEPVSA
ncbi:SDR family NAD(P)-dependent oxidoreductase [Novosphingobium malaysiense]|uniref:SDR family NAD(P)-dependent oxidoreductase n=1 Tax=Novosphingobium malaysiense TaxID=1348853 RepID=UPI00068E6952|nr:SDR family NAD(P)-dependent oxidoreductase [Novosphingobium malaysiense]